MLNNGGTCEDYLTGSDLARRHMAFSVVLPRRCSVRYGGYDGWDNLTFVAGEVKDPKRNIPLAIIGSMVLIMALYVVAQSRIFLCSGSDDYRFGLNQFVCGKSCCEYVLWRECGLDRDRSCSRIFYSRPDAVLAWHPAHITDGGSTHSIPNGERGTVVSGFRPRFGNAGACSSVI